MRFTLHRLKWLLRFWGGHFYSIILELNNGVVRNHEKLVTQIQKPNLNSPTKMESKL
jgi:hypothetical protein